MHTGNIRFERAIYELEKELENGNIRDYKIKDFTKVYNSLFTSKIRLELDNGFHDSSKEFDYHLYFRNDTNWKRCKKTGLAYTDLKDVCEGNISVELFLKEKTKKGRNYETPKHLVLVQFVDGFKCVVVDVFEDFYIHKPMIKKLFIQEHEFYR